MTLRQECILFAEHCIVHVCACLAEAQNAYKGTSGKACTYFDWFHWVHNSRLSGVHIDQQVHVVVGERREEFDLHVRLFHQR